MYIFKLIAIIVLSLSTNLHSQNLSDVNWIAAGSHKTSIGFKGEDKKNNINIKVSNNLNGFLIKIHGELVIGRITATLFDPNDKREGGFILQGDMDNKTEEISALGNINIPIQNPMEGIWTIKIEATKAHGNLKIILNP